jgi:hypothetical protein
MKKELLKKAKYVATAIFVGALAVNCFLGVFVLREYLDFSRSQEPLSVTREMHKALLDVYWTLVFTLIPALGGFLMLIATISVIEIRRLWKAIERVAPTN